MAIDPRIHELNTAYAQGKMDSKTYAEQFKILARESSKERLGGWVSPLTEKPFNFDSIYTNTPAITTPAPAITTPAPAITTPAPAITTPAPVIKTPSGSAVMDGSGNIITDGSADAIKKTPWLLIGIAIMALLFID